jgi:lipopolysaccharide transport system ATP-binding protein
MKPLISLQNIGVEFKRKRSLVQAKQGKSFWALEDITFDIYPKEVLGIMGKNGAGKSTLLSLLAGIIAPSKGTITSNVNHVSLLSLQAGFVPFLSGRKNITLSGLLLGMGLEEINKHVNDIIDFADLGTFIDEPVAIYSSGMKARLGFAISINYIPEVILIDEVLGVGDASFKKKSSAVVKKKIQDTTTVIVSHNKETISELCTRLIVISNKKIVHNGDVATGLEIYENL